MAEFRMPSLGADMEDGILVNWQIKPGDRVKRGDLIATVETQKGLFEVENYLEGIVEQLLVQPGTRVPVGTVLATIGMASAPAEAAMQPPGAGGALAEPATMAAPSPGALQPQAAGPAEAATPGPAPPSARILVSPSARRLAADLGVEIATIKGRGPHGAVQRADVEQAAAEKKGRVQPPQPPPLQPPPVEQPSAPPAQPPPETPAAPDFQAGMRQAIAAAMSRSNREIPHYYLDTEIDMSSALRWLEAENLKRPIKERLLPAVLLLKAVALALADVPELNGYWLDNRLEVREAINIGFAISLRQGGLITPAIHGVDLLGLDELMAALSDLIARTRSGHLRSSEMTDGTVTVTSLGDLGVTTVFGVIYPPQVALVGFGKITERPWAENGMLGIRRVVTATLSADHRATDGRRGSQFLEALNRHLQGPDKL